MKFSKLGQRLAGDTGTLALMRDLGDALAASTPPLMLGGGNPARIEAMEALFNRSPSGPDSPERLRRILGKDAYQTAKKAMAHEADEFEDKQVHQKVELGPIQVLQVRDDSVLTGVEGQLIRNGVFRGKPFTEVLTVKAQFQFILNPDMTANGRFPTVAIAFDFNTTPSS